MVVPSGTSISIPSIVNFAIAPESVSNGCHLFFRNKRFEFKVFDIPDLLRILHVVFKLFPEMSDGAGHRPCRSVSKWTYGLSVNLSGHIHEQVDVTHVAMSMFDAVQHLFHPAGAIPTRTALSTRFMVIEACKIPEVPHNAGCFVHHDESA